MGIEDYSYNEGVAKGQCLKKGCVYIDKGCVESAKGNLCSDFNKKCETIEDFNLRVYGNRRGYDVPNKEEKTSFLDDNRGMPH